MTKKLKEKNKHDYQIMSDKARIVFIELKKFTPETIDRQHMLDLWLSFLQNPENTEVQNVDKNVDQAFETLNFVSADQETRDYYITLAESRRDIDSERINAEKIARDKGREEERKENAKIIAETFGVSIEKAEELLRKER